MTILNTGRTRANDVIFRCACECTYKEMINKCIERQTKKGNRIYYCKCPRCGKTVVSEIKY